MAAAPVDVPFERMDGEFRTRSDAPESKPAPERAGKPLDDDHVAYREDKRPLARRGAWLIGETEIAPGKDAAGQKLAVGLLPPGTRKWAALLFLAMSFAGASLTEALAPLLDKVFGQSDGPQVTMVLRTFPEGAKASIDGFPLKGTTPMALTMAVDPGDHKLEFTFADGSKQTATATLKEGERVLLVESAPAEVSLRVTTTPNGAQVFVDGKDRGPSPVTVKGLAFGKAHEVKATKDGYAPSTLRLRERQAAQGPVHLSLSKQGGKGEVVLRSNPSAQVFIDGKESGVTSDEPRKLATGWHEVRLRVPTLGVDEKVTIEVPDGKSSYFFDLLSGVD